jgi:hypothetical protein
MSVKHTCIEQLHHYLSISELGMWGAILQDARKASPDAIFDPTDDSDAGIPRSRPFIGQYAQRS